MGVAADVGKRLVEAAEHLSGREVAPHGTLELVESTASENRLLRKTLDFVGFKLFNFQSGSPTEMKPQARRLIVQKALTAFAEDPMAGEYVDLYVSFVFGRGVPRPQAYDEETQIVLDETADDPANKRILTSFEKLVEKGIDFNIQSNVLFNLFDDGEDGRVRLSLVTFGDVEGVRRHPVDKYRILYYKVLEHPPRPYDWQRGTEMIPVGGGLTQPKVTYYEAIEAFDDENPVMRAQDARVPDDQLHPPEGLRRPGKIIHLATNKTSEDAFGIPVFRRLMRWWTVNNDLLSAHADRAKAVASMYAKVTMKGSERDLERLPSMVTGRRSAFGTAAGPDDAGEAPTPGPIGPGIFGQNESLNLEPLKLDSGSGDLAQSLPQIRAQFSGIWPTTYYGQEAGALAGAQAMELPPLKFVEREQELWTVPFKALYDRAIERAVETGRLEEWRDATDAEQARIEAARAGSDDLVGLEVNSEGKVKRDLGYDFAFPSPLKRAMADLANTAIQIATAIDPAGENFELSRWLFGYLLAEALDVSDPQRIVDQVLPRELGKDLAAGQVEVDPETGEPGWVGPDGQRHEDPANPYGAPVKSPQPEDRRVTETPAAHGGRRRRSSRATQRHRSAARANFAEVERITREHLRTLQPSRNGDGP